jgi:hypothetical protein
MTRVYYSSRKQPKKLSVDELYQKLQHLFLLLRDQRYFRERAGISGQEYPEAIKHEASLALSFEPFPITKWAPDKITEDNIFDTIEFLYDLASKPDEEYRVTDDSGFSYWEWKYDEAAGRAEFRSKANAFLADYQPGYELTEQGEIVELGAHGLRHIFNAEIIRYDEENVDSRVRAAISKWRSRHSTIREKKEAIRELADVFEWLKKTGKLSAVLDRKDESAIFEIANNFGIRHANPKQKTNYDQGIWYSWMFHFYLATYHATIRLLNKRDTRGKGV